MPERTDVNCNQEKLKLGQFIAFPVRLADRKEGMGVKQMEASLLFIFLIFL